MTTQHLGLPLPGAWETLVLLALSTAAAAALLFCADAARRRRSPLPGNAARPWLAHAAGCALLGLTGLAVGMGQTPQLPALRSQAAGWSVEGMICAGALLICALAGLWRCRREDVRPGWGVVPKYGGRAKRSGGRRQPRRPCALPWRLKSLVPA